MRFNGTRVPPVTIHVHGMFPYKPSILGYPHSRKPQIQIQRESQTPGTLDENAVPSVLVAPVSKTNILDQHIMNATWMMETLGEIRGFFETKLKEW